MFKVTTKISLKPTEHKTKKTYASLTCETCKTLLTHSKEDWNK